MYLGFIEAQKAFPDFVTRKEPFINIGSVYLDIKRDTRKFGNTLLVTPPSATRQLIHPWLPLSLDKKTSLALQQVTGLF